MSAEFTATLETITECKAQIGIIGLGYVGIPLAEAICSCGFQVTGIDIDRGKIELLNAGKSYLHHISDSRIRAMIDSGNFKVTGDFSRSHECDALLLCVPTPLGRHHEPITDFITNAAKEITPYLKKGQLIVLESSTFPGTTNEILRQILETSGLIAGKDFYIAFSPEREDPGNKDFSTINIPKIVGGSGPEAQQLVQGLYEKFIHQVVPVSRPEVAEAAKLLENIFREVNIGLVNELKMVFDAMDIDIWEVIEAAKTKPFGFMAFYPGPGVGGHCIPLDPYYLAWKAQEEDMPTRFITLAGEINEHMPYFVLDKTERALSDHASKAINGAKILIIGIAYKKNIDDCRESPSLKIAKLLSQRKANVYYHDPYIPSLPDTMAISGLGSQNSIDLSAESLGDYDAVIIATDHDKVDYQLLADHCSLVVDTRNAMIECHEVKCVLIKA